VPPPRKFMNFSSQNGVIWCILGVMFLRFMSHGLLLYDKLYRSTSLCLTNDTDWQIHVSTNPCRSNIGGVATPATPAALHDAYVSENPECPSNTM